jgi:hypothetical protein
MSVATVEPGVGVTVQEVGRIVYGEPTEETILSLAGNTTRLTLVKWSRCSAPR